MNNVNVYVMATFKLFYKKDKKGRQMVSVLNTMPGSSCGNSSRTKTEQESKKYQQKKNYFINN